MPGRAPQCRDDGRHHGTVKTVLRRQPGKRRVRHGLRKHDQRTDKTREQVGAQRRPGDPVTPEQEGEEFQHELRHEAAVIDGVEWTATRDEIGKEA